MQTMHDRSLDWMNRGHHHDAMLDAIERSRGRGFEIGAHIMLGLPGESHDDMLATAREVARLQLDAVKIHNLYCVKNTPLADQVASGEVRLMERAEYVQILVDFIELLPPTMVVDRISGDAPPDYFIGPSWCLDKPAVKQAVLEEFARVILGKVSGTPTQGHFCRTAEKYSMQAMAIVALSILAAVCYGVLHNQITARVCIEYFTIGHPQVLSVATNSPTVLGFVWGVIATWWVGLALGIPLALAARIGVRPKKSVRDVGQADGHFDGCDRSTGAGGRDSRIRRRIVGLDRFAWSVC